MVRRVQLYKGENVAVNECKKGSRTHIIAIKINVGCQAEAHSSMRLEFVHLNKGEVE